jgi:hypothetical protein
MKTIDAERAHASHVLAHGLGVGRLAARRYLAGLDGDGWQQLSSEIIQDVEYAQLLAQANDGDVNTYLEELVAKGEPGGGPVDGMERLYRAGFDVGFSSEIVERLEQRA